METLLKQKKGSSSVFKEILGDDSCLYFSPFWLIHPPLHVFPHSVALTVQA